MFGRKKKAKNLKPTASVVVSDGMKNAADTLLANIDFSSVDEPCKVVCITSSVPNEGKSTISLCLASAAGQAGKKTLIMEGDLRRRSLRATLSVHPSHGLHAVLTDAAKLEDAVVETQFKNVWFLDAEPGIPNPQEILQSKHYAALLERVAKEYDFVVIDTPPIGAFADAAVVARQADGVCLVVREGFTDKREAMLAVEQLRASGARILGAIMNCEEAGNSGHYGYYYGYYYEEKTVPADSPEAKAALGEE